MEDNKDLLKVILSYRDYYGKHHDHREKVIYATAGLFLPILDSVRKWDKNILFPLDIMLILISSIIIVLFILLGIHHIGHLTLSEYTLYGIYF